MKHGFHEVIMKISEFAEKYFGIKLYTYQKKIIDEMDKLCADCPSKRRSICRSYCGYCDKWKRLKDKSGIINFLLYKPE